jgi:hypothetical protein
MEFPANGDLVSTRLVMVLLESLSQRISSWTRYSLEYNRPHSTDITLVGMMRSPAPPPAIASRHLREPTEKDEKFHDDDNTAVSYSTRDG